MSKGLVTAMLGGYATASVTVTDAARLGAAGALPARLPARGADRFGRRIAAAASPLPRHDHNDLRSRLQLNPLL